MPVTRHALWHGLTSGALALAVAATLAGCVPEPSPTASGTGASASPSRSASAPATGSPAPSASETAAAGADIALPAACEQLYTPAMLAQLQQETPPLNDPGVTMYSTQVVGALELLNSGVPTLRCSWGTPSESGLATNVSIIDPAAASGVVDALAGSGFGCADHLAGTLCTFEQESITQDDVLVRRGESHFLRGNGWVSTAWITVDPAGYTDDIVAALWG